ncbi:BrnA antitoxin family protein [Kalamiella sp. sgz302252]|uniref:BrnA antitoxin family protein n=1 Tax=Pantoea sp. sgz302252 TaxID=3341827 RepID=UPI0036D2AF4C
MNRQEQIKLLKTKASQKATEDAAKSPQALEKAGDNWDRAERGKFYRPRKEQRTVRIDADVLYWLEQPGPGYQTRLNQILREAMEDDRNSN